MTARFAVASSLLATVVLTAWHHLPKSVQAQQQTASSSAHPAAMHSGDPTSIPTYTKDVAPIVQKNCQVCHRPGEAGPFPMLTYEQTRPWAQAMKVAASGGSVSAMLWGRPICGIGADCAPPMLPTLEPP